MCKRVCSCWSFGHASVRVGCWSVGLSWCPSACCRLSYDTLHCGYSVVSCGRGRCAARTSCSGLPAAGAMHGGDGETRRGGPSLAAGPRGGAACDVAGGLQPQLCVEAAAFGTRAGSNPSTPGMRPQGQLSPPPGPAAAISHKVLHRLSRVFPHSPCLSLCPLGRTSIPVTSRTAPEPPCPGCAPTSRMPPPRCPRDQTSELEGGSEEGLCGQTPTRGEEERWSGWGGEEKVGSEKNHGKEGLVGRKICRESCRGNPQPGWSRPCVFVSKI